MKRFLLSLIALAFLTFAPSSADAACGGGASNCYVRTAGGTWASGTFADGSSGGASCACTPAATDNLFMDSGSGNLTSVVGNPTIANFDATGYTGTFTHSAAQTLTITGNTVTFASGMTYTIGNATTSILKFASTSGTQLITTAGKTMPTATFDGVGGTFQFQDNFTNNGGVITLTNGALDTNSKTVSTGGVTSTNSNTRSITLGTTTWTLTPALGVSAWDLTTGTNLTVSAASATFNIVQTNASTSAGISFIYGGTGCTGCNSYGTINVGARSSTQQAGVAFTGTVNWTVAALNITAPNNVRIPNSVTTVTNALTWTGTASNPIFVAFFGSGGTSSNQLTASASSSIDWVALRGMNFSGTVNATNCVNLGNNTITSCTAPSSGGGSSGGRIIGG